MHVRFRDGDRIASFVYADKLVVNAHSVYVDGKVVAIRTSEGRWVVTEHPGTFETLEAEEG